MRTCTALSLLAAAALAPGCGQPQAPTEAQPLVTAVRRSPWRTGFGGGVRLDSAHYRIFTTASNRAVLRYLSGFMEAAHRRYLALTGLSDRPAEPMPIYMMGTRAEWAALTRQVVPRQAETYLAIEAGGYCYEGTCVFWDMGGTGTFATAAHEGLHQLLHHRMRHQLPMWLEEGLCVSMEGYRIDDGTVTFTEGYNPSRFNALRSAIINGHWTDLPALLPMDAGDVTHHGTRRAVAYYGQLWALVQFLRTDDRYRPGLQRLLADAEAGRLHEALGMPLHDFALLRRQGRGYNRRVSEPLFRHYISDDLEAFERELLAFAKGLCSLD